MRLFLAFLVTAVMAGAAAAAGVYRWQDVRYAQIISEQRAGLEAQVEDLSAELATLRDQIVRIAGGSGALADLTNEIEGCDINMDAASTTVEYTHERSKTVFNIPFNPVWGTGEPAPEPYMLLSGIDGVLFGRPRQIDGCSWMHTLQFTAIPARTPELIAADVGERMGIPTERSTPDLLLTQETIGENTFYSYRVTGNCMLQNYELVGEELNIILSACVEDSDDLKEVLPSVRRL
jgi:hypothetical protein